MNSVRLAANTALTMVAFASNSLLCRMALKETGIDAASFTSVRLLSGAAMLWFLMRWQNQAPLKHGSWRSALALFIYAVALSFAYRTINTGAGALMLFGAVQMTMILAGFISGERMSALQITGFVAAMTGLVILVLPGVEAPSLSDSILMLTSGIAWGAYSLFGRGLPNPAAATAGNFLRTVPLVVVLMLVALPWLHLGCAWRAVCDAVRRAGFRFGLCHVVSGPATHAGDDSLDDTAQCAGTRRNGRDCHVRRNAYARFADCFCADTRWYLLVLRCGKK